MSEIHKEMLLSALVAEEVFKDLAKPGSAAISDEKLDSIWQHLQTEPRSLQHLEPKRGKRDWGAEMKERIFGDFREGLAITRYHLDRIEQIEGEITAIAAEHEDALLGERNSTMGLHSRPLLAEYQALEFALRRTLEYLAGAASAYFKTDGQRFRTLASTIAGEEPLTASQRVRERLVAADVEQLIGERSGAKSVRDRIAHHESVSPGVINIGRKLDGSLWVRLLGEAEGLNTSFDVEQTETLTKVLRQRIESVEDLAFGIFSDLGLSS